MSSKMLTKCTPRRKSLLDLFPVLKTKETISKSQDSVEEEMLGLKQVEMTQTHTTNVPCHFCHRVANSKTRLCRNCGVSYCNTHKKAFMIKSERRVWTCKECAPSPEENIWIVLSDSLAIRDYPAFHKERNAFKTRLKAGQKVRAKFWPYVLWSLSETALKYGFTY